jgi:cell division protein FtsQ
MPEPTLRQRRLISLVFVAGIAIALAIWAVTYTPIFRADHIRVMGAGALGPAAVRDLAGVDGSTNVAHLDTDAIVARLTADPWIASASVERDLPATLILHVVEREPVAVVAAMADPTVMASDGTLLPARGSAHGLPAMHAAIGAPDDSQRVAAAALLTSLDPVVLHRVRQIVVGQDGAVSLTLRGGLDVDAGIAGEEDAKAAALRAVLRWSVTQHQELTSVDVSAPDAPSATLANGSTVTPSAQA